MGTISVQWVTDALGKPDWAALLGAAWRIGGHAMSHVYGQRLVKKKHDLCRAGAKWRNVFTVFHTCHPLSPPSPNPQTSEAASAARAGTRAAGADRGRWQPWDDT